LSRERQTMSKPTYAVVNVVLWITFFIVQVFVLYELPLTVLALLLSGTLLVESERGEIYLFSFGVFLALVIEVGLGLVARSQHWEHASLMGIPYWLPLMWGYGFVVMRRIGNAIVASFGKS